MTQRREKTAITPTRQEDYPEWYQQVIKAADMAENSPVRGCMVIKPWGFGIWENIKSTLDQMIKETGHENVYFPLFIPLSFLEKEAAHVEGFAKECAVVTHHRLEEKDGKLIPTGELEEPLIVRPTSETIIGDSFSRWVESYRDLPLLINQWANVVRWEMRPRIFLRTSEFLWQEGHTVHATKQEAKEETLKMLEVYRVLAEEVLAIPVILGEKSAGERFPGAESTYTLEMMMQDRKALQGGTSHYLGQNFARAQGIQFSGKEGELEYAYTTSWGVTTRLIGGMIMCHGDDDGLRIPPRVAPKQIVIIPVIPKPELEEEVLAFAEKVKQQIISQMFYGKPISVHIDKRDRRGGEKNWEWVKKGVPVRIEIGPRDIESDSVMLARRDRGHKEKEKVSLETLGAIIPNLLNEIQKNYFEQAKAFREMHIQRGVETLEALREFFTPKNPDKPEIHGGFVLAKWSEDPESEKILDEMKLTIRCLPLSQSGTKGKCILTGKDAVKDVIIAKSY
ncbi:prolyl-tRNA synthetase [Waddlia chondrophila 2032/99]|uniref:Proline--tRNA ligase n=2 Tax=Waddlia chondrophila TaxID=71667 RepID=D6YUF5_WADCW|nr:proline--tRNA ligase [Waddlia chondrophila]ADI37766.1 Prolyl-tRNA synthetase [Waddlia chondrophila WSU 86-1044]CCB91818.1 prolyl-tRNA synthetase [Waddlia chondrophila 2032/99]